MKTAWLLHGTGGNDSDYFWFKDTKLFLESKGYEVWWPLLPHTEKPNLEDTRNFIEDNMPLIDEETIIIGHSSACPVILDMLRWFKIEVNLVILVAGLYQSLNDDGYSDLMLPKEFDLQSAAQHAKQIVLINSENDPWGCDEVQARPVVEKLGAEFVLAKGQGHMGSNSYNQPYKEFPLLKQLTQS